MPFQGTPWWELPNKEEICETIHEKLRGRHLTEDHRKRISKGKIGKPAWNSGKRTKWIIKACSFCGTFFGSWQAADKKYCSKSCATRKRGIFNFKKGVQNNPNWREALEKALKSENYRPWKKGEHPSPKTELKKGHKLNLGRPRSLAVRLAIGKERREFFRKYPERHPNRVLIETNFISKPQREIYKILKKIFPEATLNYPIITESGVKFADIGIPSLKLDVEYDEQYWHKNRRTQDKRRDLDLQKVGWMTMRIENLDNVLEEIPCCALA